MSTEDKALAIYRIKKTGGRVALMPNVFGQIFIARLDHDGIPSGATADFTPTALSLLKEQQANGGIEWIKTPQTPYDVWHICTCEDCCPPSAGIYKGRSGGTIKTHSQGDWDSHLRGVDNKDIGTFPTIQNRT